MAKKTKPAMTMETASAVAEAFDKLKANAADQDYTSKAQPAEEWLEELLGKQEAPLALKESMMNLVSKAAELDAEIEAIEEGLKEKKFKLRELTTKYIPDVMTQAGTSVYANPDTGVKVEVKPFVSGSLPKEEDKREHAIQLICSYGAEDMIKKNFSVALSRGMIDEAKQIEEAFEAIGITYDTDVGVHASTLAAFAKERLASGKEIDLDALGLFSGRVAKITRAKQI